MNRIVKGLEARSMLLRASEDRHNLTGLHVGYWGYRWSIISHGRVGGYPYVCLHCIAYFAGANVPSNSLHKDIEVFVHNMNDSLRFYLNDLTSKTSSGAGQGSTHKPDGEINMSRNTTTRLFAIASFNLGDTVSHLMEKKLIVGFRGFYKNPRISTWSSDDVTAIPPTTAPSIEYVLLGRDGRTVVAKKDAFTLVERYESIHDKLRLGVASAFEAAKVELDDMKAEWVTGRPAAVAPVAAPVADAVEAPAAAANTVTVTCDDITATITYTDAVDLYEKLERLVG